MRTSLYLLGFFLLLTACGRRTVTPPLPDGAYFSATRYAAAAVSVLPDGELLTTPENISAYRQENWPVVQGVSTLAQVPIGRAGRYKYKITAFTSAGGRHYAHLQVLDHADGTPRRALEFIAPYTAARADTATITAARARWMQYCNAHDAASLVNNCYTANTVYYNHRPPLQGRAALIEEYAYMNNPDYRLTLTPLHVEPVAEDLVLELGQCSGSYGGQYLIVWRRGEDGVWRVGLDGNL